MYKRSTCLHLRLQSTLFLREDDVSALAAAVANWVHRTLIVCVCVCVCVCARARTPVGSSYWRGLETNGFVEDICLELALRKVFSIFKSEHGSAVEGTDGLSTVSSAVILIQLAQEEPNHDERCQDKRISKATSLLKTCSTIGKHPPSWRGGREGNAQVTGVFTIAVLGKYIGVDAVFQCAWSQRPGKRNTVECTRWRSCTVWVAHNRGSVRRRSVAMLPVYIRCTAGGCDLRCR